MCEQPALALDAAAIAGQCPVRSDDAVAGDDDADGVVPIGVAYGADRCGASDPLGERAIGDGLAAGDLAQRPPHAFLERRAPGRYRQGIDGVQLAGEISADRPAEAGGIPGPGQGEAVGPVLHPERSLQAIVLIGPFHRPETPGVIGDDGELAEWRRETVHAEAKRLAHPARISSLFASCQRGLAQRASLAVISATWRPWNRAMTSSFSLGLRLPSLPASVVAP